MDRTGWEVQESSSAIAAPASTWRRCPPTGTGVRDSIVGRLERVGGTATVVSTGQAGGRNGTEVRLVAPVAPEQATT